MSSNSPRTFVYKANPQMATEFHFFPRLPPELRRLIWEFCLPHRVVEIESLSFDVQGSHSSCKFYATSEANARPPLVTAVCQESRALAFETGDFLVNSPTVESDDPDAWYFVMNLLPNTWYNPKTDILQLNWVPVYRPMYDSAGDPVRFLVQESRACQGASIWAELLLDFSEPNTTQFTGLLAWRDDSATTLSSLWGRKEYYVVHFAVSIHVSQAQAAESGVFGRLAEERVKLVEVDDLELIERFYNLYRQGPQEDTRPQAHFDRMLNRTEEFRWDIKKWEDEVELLWMWTDYFYWKKTLSTDAGEYAPARTMGMWETDEEVPLRRPRKPNRDHWLIQKLTAEVPKFRSVVMFRLCPQNECWETSVPGASVPVSAVGKAGDSTAG